MSACDSLGEAKKFYRSHPVVVAGASEVVGELADFVGFVRQTVGEGGGYVIRLAGDGPLPFEVEVEDVIGPDLDTRVLEEAVEKAEGWLSERVAASVPVAAGESAEVISSSPVAVQQATKNPVESQTVKPDIQTKTQTNESGEPGAGSAPAADSQVAAAGATVSIRRGSALGRQGEGEGGKKLAKGESPGKTTKYQYNLLIDNAPIAMAMFDVDMRYLIANSRWREQFDLEGAELIGRGHFDLFSEVSDRWKLLLDRARREDREVVGEEFVEWPDGSTDWVRWTMRPWETKSDEPGGLVISCGVITEEKGKRGEQQFESGLAQSLMNSGITPLVVLDFDGRVVRCNRIAKRWGDWGEASGDDRYFWDAFVPAGDRQAVRESFNSYAETMDEGGEFKFPTVSVEAVRVEDGSERMVAWTNTPRVGDGGVITGLLRVGVEIRDEDLPTIAVPAGGEMDEEAVAELQDEWMDSFPLMCWRTNSRGKIKYFNRQWLDFRGRNALEECDNGWMDGLHEEDYDSLIHAFDTAAKTGARVNHVARILGGDGQYRWLRFVSARDFSDLEGASDGFLGYCEDLGRIIRLESELSAAKSRYDELLEDSTGAFRAKKSLEENITELEQQLETESVRLSEEHEAAVAELGAELASTEEAREKAVSDLALERTRLERERDEGLAALSKEKDDQQASALRAKETEIESLREEVARRVAELEKERDEKVAQGAQGIAALKADFESAAAEKERLAAEVAAEKERHGAREAELVKLRKLADVAHKQAAEAVIERDRFVAIPENAPFGMVLVGRDGGVLYANAATDKITGVEFGSFETVEDWLKQQAPSDDEGGQEKLLTLWREGVWRQDGTKVVSMQTDSGLRELELRSKLLPEGQLLLTMSDVTDSRRSEEALRASEVKFRSIFYDSGVGMALVDKTGNIFDANPAQEKLMGYTRAELRKMHIEDCLSLEEIARTQQLAKDMAEKRARSGELTLRLQPKDKRPAWAHMNVSLVRDPDGEVIFAAYFFHDVTKEREAISGEQRAISNEQRAISNEQRATSNLEHTQAEKQAIVEASPDLILVVGPGGNVENVVPPVRFPLRVDRASEGAPIEAVIPPIAADYPQLAEAARESGGVETKEFSVDQEDGALHFECRVACSGEKNTVVVVRDVTAAKKAEEVKRRQALTFASLKDAIVVADLKGRITDWNPAAQEMFGYSREEAIGMGLYMLYDREEPKRFKQTITTAIGKHRKWEGRTPFHRKDGTHGECEVRYTPLLDEKRRPLALVGVSRIAAEETAPGPTPVPAPAPAPSSGVDARDAHLRLKQSVRSLAEVMEAQEASGMLNDEVRSEIANNRARIQAITLLHDTVEEGGDFEKLDFGQYVRKLVQFMLAEFGPEHAGIEVHLNVKGIVVPTDVAQPLAIILFELLSNALRHAFARRSSGMVGVSMGIGSESGWMVVNDDGVGLPTGFNITAPPRGSGLKIASQQARQISGEIKLMDAADTEIQVGFRLNGAT